MQCINVKIYTWKLQTTAVAGTELRWLEWRPVCSHVIVVISFFVTVALPQSWDCRGLCASHQTFMPVNEAGLKTFSKSYHIQADSWLSDIEQTPCWSEHPTSRQGRCRIDTHRSLMRTSCWECALQETRRGYPSRRAEGMHMAVVSKELFVWLMLLSGKMKQHVGLAPSSCGACFKRKFSGDIVATTSVQVLVCILRVDDSILTPLTRTTAVQNTLFTLSELISRCPQAKRLNSKSTSVELQTDDVPELY